MHRSECNAHLPQILLFVKFQLFQPKDNCKVKGTTGEGNQPITEHSDSDPKVSEKTHPGSEI